MKKNKKILITLLVLLTLVVSGGTLAYWGTVQLSDTETNLSAIIGSGKTTSVSASIVQPTGYHLVPVGQIPNSNQDTAVVSMNFDFPVTWTDSAGYANGKTNTVTITPTFDATQPEEGVTAERLAALFTFTYATVAGGTATTLENNTATLTNGTEAIIRVIVTFTNEPADQTEYGKITGVAPKFSVKFEVANFVQQP